MSEVQTALNSVYSDAGFMCHCVSLPSRFEQGCQYDHDLHPCAEQGWARREETNRWTRNRLIQTVVVYTERGSNIRIISCRKAASSERKLYEEGGD